MHRGSSGSAPGSGGPVEEVLCGVRHVSHLTLAPRSGGGPPADCVDALDGRDSLEDARSIAPDPIEEEPGDVGRTDLAGLVELADDEATAVALPARAAEVGPDDPNVIRIGVQRRGGA